MSPSPMTPASAPANDALNIRASARARNPFSTRHVRPGAIPFVFPAGCCAATLVELLDRRRAGQIVGPHGSGKSTLVHALAAELKLQGRVVHRCTLHGHQRRLPLDRTDWNAHDVVIVDGYEQLDRWQRWRLRRRCHRVAASLLVTCHQDEGLTTLLHTRVDPPLARQIVNQLLIESAVTVTDQQVQLALQLHRGNLREALFELYDLVEAARQRAAWPAGRHSG